MKIIFVDHLPFLGGAQLVLKNHIEFLLAKKIDVYLITDKNSQFSAEMGLSTERVIKINFGHLKTINPIAFSRLFQSTKELGREISKLNPDLVVTNTARGFVLVGLSRFNSLKLAFIRDYEYPKLVFKLLKDRFSELMFVSRDVKTYYGASGEIIYVPSDMGRQVESLADSVRKKTRQKWGVLEEETLIGFAGRLVGWKGALTLVQSIAALPGNIKAIIAGTGEGQEDNIEPKVHKLVRSLGLENRVKLIGFERDMPSFFKSIDIFTLTSVKNEPFATTVVAAASAKVPIIATNVGGTTEFVVEGVTGLLVDPGHSEQLKNAIIKLTSDTVLKEKVVREAYAKSSDLTEEKVNSKILKIYQSQR